MSPLLPVVVGIVRSWVALYTLGLPPGLREARRTEIDCDLWEQRWLASRRGDPPLGIAIEILTRMLLGVISDITWRAEAGASTRSDRSKQLNNALRIRSGLAIGVTLALLTFLATAGFGWYLMLGVAAVAVAVIALPFFHSGRRPVTNEIGGDLMKNTRDHRWKWLLLIAGVCVATVVGIWSYAVTLDEWGGTLTTVLAVGGLLAMTIGFSALVMLVSDLMGKLPARDG